MVNKGTKVIVFDHFRMDVLRTGCDSCCVAYVRMWGVVGSTHLARGFFYIDLQQQ